MLQNINGNLVAMSMIFVRLCVRFRRLGGLARSASKAIPTATAGARLASTTDWGLTKEDGSRNNVFSGVKLDGEVRSQFPEPEYRQQQVEEFPKQRYKAAQGESAGTATDVARRRKKVLWTAGKRGWVELGPLLESFARHWIETTSSDSCSEAAREQLGQLERLLQCDDMFLARLVAGTAPVPAELDTAVLASLRDHARVSGAGVLPSGRGQDGRADGSTGIGRR